jgi:hypothetical protein
MFECDSRQVPLFQTVTKLGTSVHARSVYVYVFVCVCVCVCVCCVIVHHIIKFLPTSATRVLKQDCANLALNKICNLVACI